MATYFQIQLYVTQKYGWTPETCWISDAKKKCGLPVKDTPNRKGEEPVKPHPEDKLPAIKEAFEHFGIL
jgi:hypothetical protein